MFDNVGRKIQTVVSVVFFVQFLLSCISSFLVGKLIADGTGEMAIGLIAGVFLFVISIFLCWLSHLLLYAYGKIAECCEEQSSLLRILVVKQDLRQDGQKKICANCNSELDGDAAFCTKCGTRYGE